MLEPSFVTHVAFPCLLPVPMSPSTDNLSRLNYCLSDDLMDSCVTEVEKAFDVYLGHANGNPLVYDTVSILIMPQCHMLR